MGNGPIIGGLPLAQYQTGPRDTVKPNITGKSADRNVSLHSPKKNFVLLDTSSTVFKTARAFRNNTLAERQVSVVNNVTARVQPPVASAQQPSPRSESPPGVGVMAAHTLITQEAPVYKVEVHPETKVDTSKQDLNSNPFLTRDGKELKSSTPQPSPQALRKKRHSLSDIAKKISFSNKIAKAFGKESLSNQVLIGMNKVANYENQGIPRSYLENFQKVAEQENTIIAVRPVEMICRTLIEEGYESKGLNIKGKSSNWGPMAGLIPVDQAFSKLADSPEKVPEYNAKNHDSIHVKNSATQEHLHISSARIEELNKLGMIEDSRSIPPSSGYQKAVCFESSTKGGLTKTFEAHQKQGGQWDVFSGTGVKKDKLMVIPKTADFDLLFCFSPTEGLDLAGTDKKRGFDNELGILSDRTKGTVDALNGAFSRGANNNMVHHGADTENPVTEMEANFPATIFFPPEIRENLGIYHESPILVKNEGELVKLFRAMKNAGFDVKANPLWDNMSKVVKEQFNEKIDFFEKKS